MWKPRKRTASTKGEGSAPMLAVAEPRSDFFRLWVKSGVTWIAGSDKGELMNVDEAAIVARR